MRCAERQFGALDRRVRREITVAHGQRMVPRPERHAPFRRDGDPPSVDAMIPDRPRGDADGGQHQKQKRVGQRSAAPDPERGERQEEEHRRTRENREAGEDGADDGTEVGGRRAAGREPRSEDGRRRKSLGFSNLQPPSSNFLQRARRRQRERREQRFAEHVRRHPDERGIDRCDSGGGHGRARARGATGDGGDEPDARGSEQRLRDLDAARCMVDGRRNDNRREECGIAGRAPELLRGPR